MAQPAQGEGANASAHVFVFFVLQCHVVFLTLLLLVVLAGAEPALTPAEAVHFARVRTLLEEELPKTPEGIPIKHIFKLYKKKYGKQLPYHPSGGPLFYVQLLKDLCMIRKVGPDKVTGVLARKPADPSRIANQLRELLSSLPLPLKSLEVRRKYRERCGCPLTKAIFLSIMKEHLADAFKLTGSDQVIARGAPVPQVPSVDDNRQALKDLLSSVSVPIARDELRRAFVARYGRNLPKSDLARLLKLQPEYVHADRCIWLHNMPAPSPVPAGRVPELLPLPLSLA